MWWYWVNALGLAFLLSAWSFQHARCSCIRNKFYFGNRLTSKLILFCENGLNENIVCKSILVLKCNLWASMLSQSESDIKNSCLLLYALNFSINTFFQEVNFSRSITWIGIGWSAIISRIFFECGRQWHTIPWSHHNVLQLNMEGLLE